MESIIEQLQKKLKAAQYEHGRLNASKALLKNILQGKIYAYLEIIELLQSTENKKK